MNKQLRCIRILRIVVSIALGLMSVSAVIAQTSNEAQTLLPNQMLEREMTGAQTHRYKFDLKENEFFQVRVEQKGVDVLLKLSNTNNEELLVATNSQISSLSVNYLSLSFVATKTDAYFLEILSPKETITKGSYKLERSASRIATKEEKKETADSLTNEANNLFNKTFQLPNKAERDSYFRKAITKFKFASSLYEVLEDLDSLWKQTICSRTIGFGYNQLNENEEAINYFQKSLKSLADLEKLPNVDLKVPKTILLNDLGLTYFIEGKEEEASFYLKQIDFENIDYWKNNKDILRNSTDLMLALLNSLSEVEDYEYLINFLNKIVSQASSYGYTSESVMNFNINLGGAYVEAGYYDKAFEALQETLRINKNYNDLETEQIAKNNIGIIYLRNGNFDEAQKYIQQALDLAIKRNDAVWTAKAKANLAGVYSRRKQFDIAIKLFDETLPQLKKFRDEFASKFAETKNLNYRLEEKWLALFVTVDTYYYGTILRETGKFQEAISYHKESIELAKKVKVRKFEARARVELGLDYLTLNNPDLATEQFQKAYILSTSAKARDEQMASLDGLMRAWEANNNANLAIIYGKQSVNLLQKTRAELEKLGKSVASEFVKDNENTYRKLTYLLISEGRLPEAQAVLDLLKEEEFSSLRRRNGNNENVPYSKAEDAALKILDKLAALGREKGELAEKNEKSSLTDTERRRFKDLQNEIEVTEAEFDKSLKTLSAETDKGQNYDVVVKDAQAFMEDLRSLGSGTVALYTVIVNDAKPADQSIDKTKEQIKTGWIILVTPEFRKAYPIDVKDLEQTVFRFRAALSSPIYDPQPLAQELYKKLFLQTSEKQTTTLAADLDEYFKGKPVKTLMWSLDGVLRYVPMAALHDGKTYLVEKFRNTVFNTASKARLKDAVKPNWTVLGLGVSVGRAESGKTFASIAGAKSELLIIVRQKDAKNNQGIMPGTIKLDEQFTSEAMFDGILFDKNPVVHIASHFSFNSADFDESFLLLGKGKLTVKDLSAKSTLFSNVDLLTLSACETAVGGANGKDVEGFAYLAQSLGAKAVLATLWQVDDIGTQILMPEFYRLRESGTGKAEALRQAQLALLQGKIKDVPSDLKRAEIVGAAENNQFKLTPYNKEGKPPFAHPFYWSPFVLIGNWK